MKQRKKTRQVRAGALLIGGDAPVSIQSMTSCPIEDVDATVRQINRLREAGAEMVRLAVRNEEAVAYLKQVRKRVDIPLSADIHFNYRIAIGSLEAGVDKIRLNPGNIGDVSKVKQVVDAAAERGVPIRIGVNGGSLDRKKYPGGTPADMVESAMEHVRILEDNNYYNIVVSLKSSDINQTIEANRLFSEKSNYPQHLGLTEAGYGLSCVVGSSLAIGSLLMEGIGDTIRVSMTGDPVDEIAVARRILESAGIRSPLLRIVACPTCGRTDPGLDVRGMASLIEDEVMREFGTELERRGRGLVVAVMGCEVNGPGEASHADVGVAGGRGGRVMLFSRGERLRTINADDVVDSIREEVSRLLDSET